MNRLLSHAVLTAGLLLLSPLAAAAEHIYPDVSTANADIAAALKEAATTHRRVIIDFGGDWCTDCKVLDLRFREPVNAELLQRHYVLVHVQPSATKVSRRTSTWPSGMAFR